MPAREVPEPKGPAMPARSVVFDLFGDYLRYRGGEARLLDLVTLLGYFGVGESTARVTVARLRKEGWFETRSAGRQALYSLTDQGWKLLDEGRERIFKRAQVPWDGQWHMVIYSVSESNRSVREDVRKALTWLGFGPLASSTWVSPHDRLPRVAARFRDEEGVTLDFLHCRTGDPAADRAMVSRCWDLPALKRAHDHLITVYRDRLPAYRANALEPAAALVERTRLIHSYRKFPFRDPDLPPELVPSDWRGNLAHDIFLEGHDLLAEAANRCVSEVIGSEEPGTRRPAEPRSTLDTPVNRPS